MSRILNMQDFDGVVVLKDWMIDPFDGLSYRSFRGTVSILEGKDAMGFDPGKNEANWFARIEGPTLAVNIPGCQIRAVISVKTKGERLPDTEAPGTLTHCRVVP